jgi:hypothetical protein
MMWIPSLAVPSYGSVALPLRKLAAQVVSGALIVNTMIIPPLPDASNYSYTISFHGPALRCAERPPRPNNTTIMLYSAHQVK